MGLPSRVVKFDLGFGQIVRNKRGGADLRIQRLCEILEIDLERLSLIERCKELPTLDELVKICDYFDIGLPQILEVVERNHGPDFVEEDAAGVLPDIDF